MDDPFVDDRDFVDPVFPVPIDTPEVALGLVGGQTEPLSGNALELFTGKLDLRMKLLMVFITALR